MGGGLGLGGRKTDFMRQHPTTILAAFDGREEEMHVGPDPAVEGVAVFAKMLGFGVFDHVCVWEPGFTMSEPRPGEARGIRECLYQARKTA